MAPEGADLWRTRVRLATDGSRFSDAAAVATAKIAALGRLPVTVISIVRESFTEQRAAEADEAAARVHAHLSARGLEVDKVVLRGDPAALIVETAAARAADLIVMGTHGRTGWERVLVGSVTVGVINETPLPVLAVKLYRRAAGAEECNAPRGLDHNGEANAPNCRGGGDFYFVPLYGLSLNGLTQSGETSAGLSKYIRTCRVVPLSTRTVSRCV